MKEKMIRTLMVEPNKHPCIKVLENNLDSLQKMEPSLSIVRGSKREFS